MSGYPEPPWFVNPTGDIGPWHVGSADGPVADVSDEVEDYEAAARLIAAAPDLLEAAKAARQVLTVMFNARKDGPGRQAYDKLGAAIARAEEGSA